MTRTQMIARVGELIDDNKRLSLRTPQIEGRLGELERFCNDLCTPPTKWNRDKGATTYTIKEAARKLCELTPTLPRYFEDGAFVERILNPSGIAVASQTEK